MAEENTENSITAASGCISMNEEANNQQETPGDELSFDNSDEIQIHEIEDSTRDLCMLRQSIPSRVALLVEEQYRARKPAFHSKAGDTDIAERELSFEGFNECREKWAQYAEMLSTSKELQEITERCSHQLQYTEMKCGMDFNKTQELLTSQKQKRKIRDSEQVESATNNNSIHITKPGRDNLPSLSTPTIENSSKKLHSSSKIPIRQQDPFTPLTTRSSSARKTRSTGKKRSAKKEISSYQ